MLDIIFDAAVAFKLFFGAVIAYLFHKLRKIENKSETILSRKEIKELVHSEIAPMKVRQEDLKEDLARIEKKLDILIEQKLR